MIKMYRLMILLIDILLNNSIKLEGAFLAPIIIVDALLLCMGDFGVCSNDIMQ